MAHCWVRVTGDHPTFRIFRTEQFPSAFRRWRSTEFLTFSAWASDVTGLVFFPPFPSQISPCPSLVGLGLISLSCSLVVQFWGLESVSLEVQDRFESCLPDSWKFRDHKSRNESPSHHNYEHALVATNVNHFLGVRRLPSARTGVIVWKTGSPFAFSNSYLIESFQKLQVFLDLWPGPICTGSLFQNILQH